MKRDYQNGGEHVFHIHEYSAPGIDYRQPARNITPQEYKKYKKFFKGVKLDAREQPK